MPRSWLLAVVLLASAARLSPAQPVPEQQRPGRARLLLLLVVDQVPAGLWQRHAPALAPDGGIARLRRHSARWTQAAYEHLVTSTAAGHATLATGASPSRHGVVGNRWYDRERARVVSCVEQAVRAAAPRELPLAVPTLADALRRSYGDRVRIGAISWKDRAAILLGGTSPDAVAWFDPRRGRWRGYGRSPVVRELLALGDRRARACFGRPWGPLRAAEFYPERDDRPFERDLFGLGRSFPHPVDGGQPLAGPGFFAAISLTPYPDEIVCALAEHLLEREPFGRDDVPDLLALSFSSSDLVGHTFGPGSREYRDVHLRLDALLGRLLDRLERRIGRDRLLVVLTSDHGASPIVESLPGGRRISIGRALATAAAAARDALGGAADEPPVAAFCPPHLYLRAGARAARVTAEVARALEGIDGVGALACAALDGPRPAAVSPRLWEAARRSVFAPRSGDVLVWLAPHCSWSPGKAAEHGRPCESDMRVPLWIRAPGLEAGRREGRAPVRRLAASLAHLLGMAPPAAADPVLLPGLR